AQKAATALASPLWKASMNFSACLPIAVWSSGLPLAGWPNAGPAVTKTTAASKASNHNRCVLMRAPFPMTEETNPLPSATDGVSLLVLGPPLRPFLPPTRSFLARVGPCRRRVSGAQADGLEVFQSPRGGDAVIPEHGHPGRGFHERQQTLVAA